MKNLIFNKFFGPFDTFKQKFYLFGQIPRKYTFILCMGKLILKGGEGNFSCEFNVKFSH